MAYSYIAQQWAKKSPEFKDWLRQMAVGWRREPVVKRLARPTRLDRARRLGYKPKQGILVARVRVRRGGARKPRPVSGRRQKAMGSAKYTRAISLLEIAENRAQRKYPNLDVSNSYHLYSDGKNHWYEVILRDPDHPAQK
jgi:large subunit ribosomal protein L15e